MKHIFNFNCYLEVNRRNVDQDPVVYGNYLDSMVKHVLDMVQVAIVILVMDIWR